MKQGRVVVVAMGIVIGGMAAGNIPVVRALTATASTVVTVTMPLRAELDIIRDPNSVTRGAVDEVLFDKIDDQDEQADGSPDFMYAPYRSEVGKNWHLAQIVANGSTMTLSAAVVSNGATDVAAILDVFFGGFFESDGNSKGGASGDWELLNGFTRILNEPFSGTAPFNYRLRIRGVPGGTHTANVTYTLMSN